MVGYPRALRRAHEVILFHPGDARAFVADKIDEATRAGHDAQAVEWQKILHFVERLLDQAPPEPARSHHPRRRRAAPRYRRVRTPIAP
jgi:hypothetical protein